MDKFKQSDIWLEKEKCEKLLERWGDYDKFELCEKRENKNKKCIIDTLFSLIDSFDDKPSILEVGCGTGHFLWTIKDKVSKIIALDYSNEMLKLTKKQFDTINYNNIEYVQGNCFKLPFSNDLFDISYQIDTTMHIGGSWDAIKQMIRVSKKYILFTGPSFDNKLNESMNKQIGKLSWAVSVPLLENKLGQMIKNNIIKNFKYIDRPKTNTYKHRILVIEK